MLARHGNAVRIDEAVGLGVYDAHHLSSTGLDLRDTEVVLVGDPQVTIVIKCDGGWMFERNRGG